MPTKQQAFQLENAKADEQFYETLHAQTAEKQKGLAATVELEAFLEDVRRRREQAEKRAALAALKRRRPRPDTHERN